MEKEAVYREIKDKMPLFIDSYDNDSFCMLLEEVSDIKRNV